MTTELDATGIATGRSTKAPLAAGAAADDVPHYRGRYAGFVSRMAAGGIDVVVCAIGGTGLVFFAQALGAVVQGKPVGDVTIDQDIATFLISLLILVYFTASWAVTGRTVGEALMGLRVIRNDGRRVHFIRSFVRVWIGAISFAFFGLGFIWMIFDPRRRAWQDIVARTIVIYDWDE
jgi:uncharacterized RDD family membrane protein YckC